MATRSMANRVFSILPAWAKAEMKRQADQRRIRVRHRAAGRQIVRAAVDISSRCLEDVRSLEDWQGKRIGSRRQLLAMLGLDPFPERTPLAAQITGVLEQADVRIEKLVFQSRPGLFVTANFYLPREPVPSLPCVVYLNGHWPSLDGAKTGFQDRYLWYPTHGFALLVVDPLGFGEIAGLHPGMNRHNQWHWLSLGYTPAAVEVWNAMRALDWLATRPEIDSARIGVTGVSGGGVMTQFLAALDERVAVAAPSCSTYTLGSQAARDLVPLQCDCTFYPNVHQMDFPEVLALIAPRPLMILGGRKDPIFPPPGFREAFRRVKRVYDLYDGPENSDPRLRLVESNEGHTDPPRFLAETHRWMCRWLRGCGGAASLPEREALNPLPSATLRCTDAAVPEALNDRIHDIWIARPATAAPKTRAEWSHRQAGLQEFLRKQVFGWFPSAEIPFRTRRFPFRGGYAGECADFGEYEFDSEAEAPVRVRLLKPRGCPASAPLIVWVKDPGSHVVFPDLDEFFPVLRSHALAILTPRFADRPLDGPEYARIERTAALSGRSVTALQVWDVLRTLAWVGKDGGLLPADMAVYGQGAAGIVGLYAALFAPAIGHVILRDPPFSHREGPALPMVLRETDLDEIVALLAPRRLSLLSGRADGFEMARVVYDLLDAKDRFRRVASPWDALRLRAGDPGAPKSPAAGNA